MEQLKIKKRDSIVKNSIIHLVLSFLFLYVEYAYRHHLSPISFILLKKSFFIFLPQIILFLIASKLIWSFHKYSRIFFVTSVLLVIYKIAEGLFIDFNKLVILASFCYITVSFFLYHILDDYFKKPFLNTNYSSSDLFTPLLKVIPVKIRANERDYDGQLTNWAEDGCFVKLQEPLEDAKEVSIQIVFFEKSFIQTGEVVAQSRELNGVGIKFYSSKKELNIFNWAEFIELTEELGFQAERLR